MYYTGPLLGSIGTEGAVTPPPLFWEGGGKLKKEDFMKIIWPKARHKKKISCPDFQNPNESPP